MIERHWSWRVWRYFRVLSNERHCRSIECVKAFRREFQLKQKHNQVTQLVQQFEGFSTFEGKSLTWALEIEQNNFTPFHQNKLAEFVLVSTANGGFLLFRWPFPSCAIVYRVFAIELFVFFWILHHFIWFLVHRSGRQLQNVEPFSLSWAFLMHCHQSAIYVLRWVGSYNDTSAAILNLSSCLLGLVQMGRPISSHR